MIHSNNHKQHISQLISTNCMALHLLYHNFVMFFVIFSYDFLIDAQWWKWHSKSGEEISISAPASLCLLPFVTIYVTTYVTITSSTAQGGGASFKNRKPIGEVGCCESRKAERSHWWIERWLMSPLFLSFFSLSQITYLPTYLPTHRSIYLPTYLSIYLSN